MQVYIPTDRGIKIVPATNIIRIEAYSNYSKIYFDNGVPLTVAKVLHWFEDRLPVEFFCRIHRTHIINRIFILTISCSNTITLMNGEKLQISRRKKHSVRQKGL